MRADPVRHFGFSAARALGDVKRLQPFIGPVAVAATFTVASSGDRHGDSPAVRRWEPALVLFVARLPRADKGIAAVSEQRQTSYLKYSGGVVNLIVNRFSKKLKRAGYIKRRVPRTMTG